MQTTDRNGVPGSVLAVLAAGRPEFGGVFADTAIATMRARQGELVAQQENIYAQAQAENNRPLTTEENNNLDNLQAEWDRLEADCARRERLNSQLTRMSEPQPRASVAEPIPGDDPAPEPVSRPRAGTSAPALSAARQVVRPLSGNGGFNRFGDFAQAVVRASRKQNPQIDNRLQAAAASSITQESVGADGGFAVPPDFLTSIQQTIMAQNSLISLTNPLTVGGNSIVIPMDETTQWGTGGIKAYWENEAGAIAQSKIALNQTQVRLNKLAALVPVTEEMLEDAAGIDSYLRSKAPAAIDWQLSYALVWGTGAGQPLGIMNSPALVTQAAEGSQTADTINANNVVKMLSRLPAQSRSTAVWLIHPDAEPQLPLMTLGNQPVYLPPGGLSDAPLGRLLGRPVIPHQVASTVGDLGDIMLVDWAQYLTAIKSGGVKLNVSIHLWFDQDIQAFKFTIRVAGQPYWSAPMSPRSGTTTQSPYVTLAAR